MSTPVFAVGMLASFEWVGAGDEHHVLHLPFFETLAVAPVLGMTSHLCGDIAVPVCSADASPT